jgi:Conserved in the green lineage and diatoms 27
LRTTPFREHPYLRFWQTIADGVRIVLSQIFLNPLMSSVSPCPVPKEQQPINEYQALQQSWFFGWGKIDRSQYGYKMLRIWLFGMIITGPIADVSFGWQQQPLYFALAGMGGALLFVGLTTTYLYTGWSHIDRRLRAESIVYEESGWYDGQTWTKTAEILARDRLLAIHEVQPVMKRIKLTFLTLLSAIFIGMVAWQIGSFI